MHSEAFQPNPLARQEGLTLVEVMVAMVILVVGMLGLVSMLTTGQHVTTQNLTRDAASSLAREGIERARELAYADLASPNTVAGALWPVLEGSSASSAATFTTARRGVTYTTTISTCVLDDPSDGIGLAPGTPCKPLSSTEGGGAPVAVSGSGSLLDLNVLGIQFTGTGSLVDAVCSLIGRNTSVLDGLIGRSSGALSGLVSTGADVGVCSGTGQAVAVDRQPSDATAITAVVSWPNGNHVTQRSLVSGPRVTS